MRKVLTGCGEEGDGNTIRNQVLLSVVRAYYLYLATSTSAFWNILELYHTCHYEAGGRVVVGADVLRGKEHCECPFMPNGQFSSANGIEV